MKKGVFSSKALSKRCYEYRDETGLSQDAFAEKAGVSHATVARFENGDPIRVSTADKIKKALGEEGARNGITRRGTSKKAKTRPKVIKTRAHMEKKTEILLANLARSESQNHVLRSGLRQSLCDQIEIDPPKADKIIDWVMRLESVE